MESSVQRDAARWRVDDGTAWTAGHDRVVVLDLDGETAVPIALQGSAAAVWSFLVEHGPVALPELVAVVAAAFEVEEAHVAADVAALLDELRRQRVVACD